MLVEKGRIARRLAEGDRRQVSAAIEPALSRRGKMAKPASAKDVHYAFSLPAAADVVGSSRSVAGPYSGRILRHPRIVLIYWGSAWANAAEPSQAEFTAAISDLFTGPWSVQLAKYRGIGPISLELVAQVPQLDPPANFTNQWVRAFLDGLIARGAVPPPSNSADRIYCVMMPPGCSSIDNPENSGQHQHYDRADGARVYWVWIASDGSLSGIPTIMSEELMETCSGPDRN